MDRRTISGFEASLMGLGTSRLASLGSGRSKADARLLLSAAKHCGINFIDTADTYGSTAAERWIGELTASDSDYWIITTKTGLPTVDLPGPLRALNQPAKKVKQRLRNTFAIDIKNLRRTIGRSLNRLRRERIEILLLHLPPAGIANDDELHHILREVQRSGMIAEFGVSSDSLDTIARFGDSWGTKCAETHVAPDGPAILAKGALADFDVIANHVMGSFIKNADSLGTNGKGPHFNSRQRLLRHAAAVPGVKVVLTGTSSLEHLRENAKAFETPVTSADLIV